MRLPGFTAEQALSRTRAPYKMAGALARPAASGVVLPQFWRCWGDFCCNEWGYCIYKGHLLM